jgi:hypothetical protein
MCEIQVKVAGVERDINQPFVAEAIDEALDSFRLG